MNMKKKPLKPPFAGLAGWITGTPPRRFTDAENTAALFDAGEVHGKRLAVLATAAAKDDGPDASEAARLLDLSRVADLHSEHLATVGELVAVALDALFADGGPDVDTAKTALTAAHKGIIERMDQTGREGEKLAKRITTLADTLQAQKQKSDAA